MKSTLRRGFTLKELVVVVGLLGVVGVVVRPIFYRSLVCGNVKSPCQQNLKKIALAFKQYLNDYDERYPLVVVTDATGTTYTPPFGWADALQPYLKDTEVLQCPTDVSKGDKNSGNGNFSDYWYNANFIREIRRENVHVFTGVNESMFGSCTQTIMAADGGNVDGNITGDARYNQCGDGSSLTRRRQVCAVTTASKAPASYPSAQLHLDGCNFAFADGHVKWFKANNATQSAQVWGNATRAKDIEGRVTFSLLNT